MLKLLLQLLYYIRRKLLAQVFVFCWFSSNVVEGTVMQYLRLSLLGETLTTRKRTKEELKEILKIVLGLGSY